MPLVVQFTGFLPNLGYQLVFPNGNPALFHYLKVLNIDPEPSVPERYADVIQCIRDYPELGDVCEVRYLKMRSPVIQIPNVPEWVGAGYSIEFWVNPFFANLPFQLWAAT